MISASAASAAPRCCRRARSQDISDYDRLVVTERLQQLQEMTPGEDVKKERQSWQMVMKYAPELIKATPVVIKVIEAVRTL